MVLLIMSWGNNDPINDCLGGEGMPFNCVQGLNFPHCSSIGGVIAIKWISPICKGCCKGG